MPTKRKFSGRGGGGKRAKTAFRGRRSTSRKLANLRNNKFTRKIKAVITKMAEPKHYITTVAKFELYHNGGAILHSGGTYLGFVLNAGWPSQGVQEIQRIGDRYQRSGWKVNLLLGQKFDRPNVTFRLLVVRVPWNTQNLTFAAMHEAGGSGNMLLDSINTDRVKIMYQKYIKKNWSPTAPQGSYTEVGGTGTSVSGGKELTWAHKFWIPCRTEVKFPIDTLNSAIEPYTYVCMIAAYDAYGTLGTDNIGYVHGFVKEFYRDP